LIKNLLDQNNMDFVIEKKCISLYTLLWILCQRWKFENKDIYFAFSDLKRGMTLCSHIYNVLLKIHYLGIRGKCYNLLKTYTYLLRFDGQLS